MRNHFLLMLALIVALASGCAKNQAPDAGTTQTPEQRASVEASVRQFVAQVAEDVTREGPLGWKKEFSSAPEFFMASEGKLAFSSGPAAMQGIDGLPHIIKRIELHWGDDLRVDVLTPTLAMVGTSYEEAREDPEGHHLLEKGYFTGLVEQRNAHWQFRNAHWSVSAETVTAK